jgi:hypothetical protein
MNLGSLAVLVNVKNETEPGHVGPASQSDPRRPDSTEAWECAVGSSQVAQKGGGESRKRVI